MHALRAELLKMRSMPGVWVTWSIAVPLTVLGCLGVFAVAANGDPGHALNFPQTLHQRRMLLGAGYGTMQVLAPILGVLCITTEYRNKTITTSLILVPIRTRVIAAKVVVVALWSIFMVILSLVTVAAVGLPWNAALGGSASQIFDQVGAVLPGLLRSHHPARPLRARLRHLGQEPGGRHPHHHRGHVHPRGDPGRAWPGPSSTTT